MKRKEYEQRKAFAGDKQPSMLRRRLDHDYTGKRIYLITMTTEGRQPRPLTTHGTSKDTACCIAPHNRLQGSMHHVASKDTACCMVGGGRWEPDLTGGVNEHN